VDDLVGELVLEERVHVLREHEADDGQCHLEDEKEEQAHGVQLQQPGVLAQCAQAAGEADREDDDSGDDHDQRDVEDHIVDGVQSQPAIAVLQFVHEGVDADGQEQAAKEPEEEVQQEDHVLDAGRNVAKVVRVGGDAGVHVVAPLVVSVVAHGFGFLQIAVFSGVFG